MTQCHRCAWTLIPLVPALAVVGMDAHADAPPSQLTLEPYTFSSRSGETIEAVLGTLVVPYDRSRGDSETIALKFVRFPATTDDPGPPLVYLAGGAGGSGIGAARGRRFELFMKLREIANHPVYGKLIPDFTQLLREVLERAEREPYAVEVEDPATGQTVTTLIGRLELESVTWSALFRRDRMGVLPAAYLSTKMGMTQMLGRVVQSTRGPSGGGNAMSLAMDCVSGVSPDRLARIRRDESGSLFGRKMNFRMLAMCPELGIPDLGESFRAPVQSNMPVLCISGEMDVRTPPSNAEAVLEGFPNGHHVIISRAGHDNELWVSSPKIAECIIAFFQGRPIPYQRIELPPIEFMVPPEFIDE